MVQRVESDRREVRTALESLLEVIIRHGATINPALRIVEHDGNVSVSADAPRGEILVDLPEELFVPLKDAQWDSVGDRLVIRRHGFNATEAQREVSEALVDVYNATGKLALTRANHPLAVFEHDAEVVDVLKALRPTFFDPDSTPVDVFIGSRCYTHNGDRWLLPVIDLMNNRRSGAALRVVDGSMTVDVSRPSDADTDAECFVYYGPRHDTIDLALIWGYLDCEVAFARSIPLVARVDRVGTIEVLGNYVRPRYAIDPPSLAIADDRLTISHVTFEAQTPHYLYATLRLAVEALLRHTGSAVDSEVATHKVRSAIASLNLERLAAAGAVLGRRSGKAADLVTAALERQRATILRTTAAL